MQTSARNIYTHFAVGGWVLYSNKTLIFTKKQLQIQRNVFKSAILPRLIAHASYPWPSHHSLGKVVKKGGKMFAGSGCELRTWVMIIFGRLPQAPFPQSKQAVLYLEPVAAPHCCRLCCCCPSIGVGTGGVKGGRRPPISWRGREYGFAPSPPPPIFATIA